MYKEIKDEERRRRLRKMKFIAGSLLLCMAGIFVFSHVTVEARGLSHWNWLAYVRSFAEAAMVGGIADWFAVTALFKRPLGLPVPHTAIIPEQKNSISESLGGFVESNFFDPKQLEEKINSFHLEDQIEDWIKKKENIEMISETIAGFIPKLINSLDDDQVRLFIETRLLNRVEGQDVAALIGRLLHLLITNRKHEAVFDQLLKVAKKLLDENSDAIRKKIKEESPWFVPDVMSKKIYEKLVLNLESTFKTAADDPNHPLRIRFNEAVEAFVEDLKGSEEAHKKIEEIKQELLGNPVVDEYFSKMWQDIKHYILENLTHPDSSIKEQLQKSVYNMSYKLLDDKELRQKFYDWIKEKILELAVEYKSTISNMISSTMKKWDKDEISEKLELYVGKDLQYIRVSGTLVGGMIGLTIHAATHLISAF